MAKQTVVVQVDGAVVLEYDRRKPLNQRQKEGLARIDEKLAEGFHLGVHSMTQPTPLEYTEFVASALIKALQNGNDAVAAASCSWLANRIPELRQIKAKTESENNISIELVFNRDYQPEQVIRFVPKTH